MNRYHCFNCGYEFRSDSKQCPACGHYLSSEIPKRHKTGNLFDFMESEK